jgi:YesN/AraC family two-component response regulator
MEILWDKNKMLKLMESFNALVNVRISLFNLDKKAILFHPEPLADYCSIIRENKTGSSACKQCDEQAFSQALKANTPYTYLCHAGLREMVLPIITYDKEHIGYLMMGQVRQEKKANEHFFREICSKHGIQDVQKLKSAYSKLPILDTEQCMACANVLQALATHVLFDHYFHCQNEPLSARVSGYISKNLDKELSLQEITQYFKVGKTTLCKSVKRDFDKTVIELIHSLRIEKAKQLLQTTDLAIYIIADQVGIPDYNYFTKVFIKETGGTPSHFRKISEEEYRKSRG